MRRLLSHRRREDGGDWRGPFPRCHVDNVRPGWSLRSAVAAALALAGIIAVLSLLGCERGTNDHRARRLRDLERQRFGIPAGSILFLGSSTIERFPLAEMFPGKPVVNLGVGNENTAQLRERLVSTMPQAAPSGIVLYAGSADLRFEPTLAPAEIRKRLEGVVTDLRARFPGAPIVSLEVLPARGQSAAEQTALRALHQELENFARDRGLTYVRTHRPPLVDGRGDLLDAISTDRHHLNDAGYRALAAWIVEDGGAVGELLR